MSEELQRTDVRKGEFSPSGIQTAACYRKFYFEKILGLSYTGNVIALNFGSAIHAGVEQFYKLHSKDIPYEDMKRACVAAFVEEWVKYCTLGDSKRNLDTGMLTIANYCDTYRYDSSSFELADIECTQWLPMENGTKLLVKLDRVQVTDTLIRLVDTKTTTSALTDFFFKKFENDLQTTLYHIVVETLLGRCDDIQIDAIKVPPNSGRQQAETLVRRCFMRTDLQIEDCINSYTQVTNYIMDGLAKPQEKWASHFYCNTAECDKYGGCKFLPLCTHGLNHPSMGVDFVMKGKEKEEGNEDKPLTIRSHGRIISFGGTHA